MTLTLQKNLSKWIWPYLTQPNVTQDPSMPFFVALQYPMNFILSNNMEIFLDFGD